MWIRVVKSILRSIVGECVICLILYSHQSVELICCVEIFSAV